MINDAHTHHTADRPEATGDVTATTPNTTILGIDPGYDRCGFAVIERSSDRTETVLHSECVVTQRSAPFGERLRTVGVAFEQICEQYDPQVCAIEKVYFAKNQKTAMQVAEVRGMLLYLAISRELKIVEYTPNEVKVAIAGDGGADKRQVMYMVPKLVTLPHTPTHDDEYDALAVALTASARLGSDSRH